VEAYRSKEAQTASEITQSGLLGFDVSRCRLVQVPRIWVLSAGVERQMRITRLLDDQAVG
jgi:hypothetical protein